jgi:hypothetical protein
MEKLKIPSRTSFSSEVFQTRGKPYTLEKAEEADTMNDLYRARVRRDKTTGRADNAYYDVADPRDLVEIAEIPERSLRPTMAKRELMKRSDEGEFAAPGYGDQGQFFKKGGSVKKISLSNCKVSTHSKNKSQQGW